VIVDVLGWLKLMAGDWAGAVSCFRECRPVYERLGLKHQATLALMTEGVTRKKSAGDRKAIEQINRALASFRELEDPYGIGLCLTALGEDARLTGRMRPRKLISPRR